MRPSHLLAAVFTTSICLGIPWNGACAQPARPSGLPVPLDHYNVYDYAEHGDAGAPPFTLADEWGVTAHPFAIYDRFLVPTEQNDEPIINPDLHYARYLIASGGELPRMISVTNKFGEDQDWVVGASFALLNPAAKEGGGGEAQETAANHFKCYAVESGPFVGTEVVLLDQFGFYAVTVTEAAVWCNPAEKRLETGEVYPIEDEMAWLACYYTTPPTFFAPAIPVVVADQFGTVTHEIVSREVLCVPSQKAMPIPTETTSWGGIKATYR
jgi:hypothetical protein